VALFICHQVFCWFVSVESVEKVLMQTKTLYDRDFYAWTQQQAELIKTGNWQHVDVENLVEEIESLGKQQRQELHNRLGILLGHLLKSRYKPEGIPIEYDFHRLGKRIWRATIREQRRAIQRHLHENPSLKPHLPEAIEIGYQDGLDLFDRETTITPEALQALPQTCPFSEFEIFEEPIKLD
jgi:Domain of unknown function DUF29